MNGKYKHNSRFCALQSSSSDYDNAKQINAQKKNDDEDDRSLDNATESLLDNLIIDDEEDNPELSKRVSCAAVLNNTSN